MSTSTMGTDSMIPVSVSFDKYDTRIRPIPSWVSTVIEVSVGIHRYPLIFLLINFFFKKNFLIYLYFGTNNNFFLITKTLQLLNILT